MSSSLDKLAAFKGPDGGSGLDYWLLDVFAPRAFAGNQLAVFTDGSAVDGPLMQRLARELNLSESVFLLAPEGGGDVRVRIFTPAVELPFAGHPVLGTGVLVALALGSEQVTLETGAGPVPVTVTARAGRRLTAWMEQPLPSIAPYEQAAVVLKALGLGASGLPVEVYENGPRHVFVEASDEATVGALDPDLRALASLGQVGVSCFARTDGGFKTRMFGPGLGVAEDPATGSAAGPLAVHLARHGRIAFGDQIEIRQGEELGRPSVLLARVRGTAAQLESVSVGGDVLLVGQGRLASTD